MKLSVGMITLLMKIKGKEMPKFRVGVREVHLAYYEVEADSPSQALEKVSEGECEDLEEIEYSDTLNQETWLVENLETKEVSKNKYGEMLRDWS